jgi:hypothetical protein
MLSQNSKHDIAVVLTHYGFNLPAPKHGWVSVRCAFHDDTVKSARLNIDNGGFRCFACDMAGDVYSIIMKKENVKYAEAVKIAERITGKSEREVRGKPSGDNAVPTDERYHRGNGNYISPRFRKGT